MNPITLITGLYHYVFYEPIFNLLMGIYAPLQNIPMALAFSIILMTLMVRALLVPVFVRQLRSSKSMQEIGPEIQELQRKYRQEPMVLQQEMNKLYKERGVNPYMGCLPLLVQLPFLWSVYGSLNAILGFINSKNHITGAALLRNDLYPFVKNFLGSTGIQSLLVPIHTSFLGINLAKPDSHFILPVIAAVLTFAQMRMTLTKKPAAKPGAPPDPNAASMQMMQYLMPVMTLFFGLRFPAGLALYWCVTTAFTIGQQYFVNGRSWGGLFRGIPRLDPELRVAGVPAALVASTARSARGSRTVDAASSPKALPAAQSTKSTKANAYDQIRLEQQGVQNASADDAESGAFVTEKATKVGAPARPITRPLPKSGAVKLVSANGGTANGGGTVIAPRVAKPAVAGAVRASTGSKPRPTANTPKPTQGARLTTSSKAPSRSKKGGR